MSRTLVEALLAFFGVNRWEGDKVHVTTRVNGDGKIIRVRIVVAHPHSATFKKEVVVELNLNEGNLTGIDL